MKFVDPHASGNRPPPTNLRTRGTAITCIFYFIKRVVDCRDLRVWSQIVSKSTSSSCATIAHSTNLRQYYATHSQSYLRPFVASFSRILNTNIYVILFVFETHRFLRTHLGLTNPPITAHRIRIFGRTWHIAFVFSAQIRTPKRGPPIQKNQFLHFRLIS